jgi:DNA repair protein RadC
MRDKVTITRRANPGAKRIRCDRCAEPITEFAPVAKPKRSHALTVTPARVQLVADQPVTVSAPLFGPEPVAAYLLDELQMHLYATEHFLVMAFDSRGRMTHHNTISVGTLNQALVHPRSVFQFALLANANTIAIAHNHPSGDDAISDEDVRITTRILEAGTLMGIELVDHLIVTPRGATSIRQERPDIWQNHQQCRP